MAANFAATAAYWSNMRFSHASVPARGQLKSPTVKLGTQTAERGAQLSSLFAARRLELPRGVNKIGEPTEKWEPPNFTFRDVGVRPERWLDVAASYVIGRRTTKRVSPGVDSTETSPWCASTTILRTMSSPSPVPLPTSLVVKNGSKIRETTSAGMPAP